MASRDGHQVLPAASMTPPEAEERLPLRRGHLALLDRPPRLARTVDDALAGDGDVLGALGPDRRSGSHAFAALERRAHKRVVVEGRAEEQQGAAFEMQVDPALQFDGPREEHAAWHHDAAASGLRARLDGGGNRLGVERGAVAPCPVLGDAHGARGNLRQGDRGHRERQVGREAPGIQRRLGRRGDDTEARDAGERKPQPGLHPADVTT